MLLYNKIPIFFLIIVHLLSGCTNTNSLKFRRDQVIILQPLNSFPDSLLPVIRTRIKEVYGFKTVVAPLRSMPQNFYNGDKGPRYCADSILRFLLQQQADTVHYIAGLTTADIFTNKEVPSEGHKYPLSAYKNWGIFGLGFQPGKSNIVSIHRLGNGVLLKSRIRKIVIHEIGHNLGLPHCTQPGCVMQDAMKACGP